LAANLNLSGTRLQALAGRFGWIGSKTLSTQEAGRLLGLSRTRIQQLIQAFARRLNEHPVFMPPLDRALATLEQAAPLSMTDARRLLVEHKLIKDDSHVEVIVRAAKLLRRDTHLEIKGTGLRRRLRISDRPKGSDG
jgi:hypothetical protein